MINYQIRAIFTFQKLCRFDPNLFSSNWTPVTSAYSSDAWALTSKKTQNSSKNHLLVDETSQSATELIGLMLDD